MLFIERRYKPLHHVLVKSSRKHLLGYDRTNGEWLVWRNNGDVVTFHEDAASVKSFFTQLAERPAAAITSA